MKSSPVKSIVIVLFLFGITTGTVAQEILEGFLADRSTHQPIAFASVSVKAKTGTISNEEGYFRLDAKGITTSDTLLITHIDYVSYVLPVRVFREQGNAAILLSENSIELAEIEVQAAEDYQVFEEIVAQTKKNLHFPMTASLYYRESVRENKSYNKFADGLLTVVYEKNDDDTKIRMKIDQCRTEALPRDEDDQFELVSPVKMELVLGYEFGNFLNRFRNDKRENYHFYSLNENTRADGYYILIQPKKEANREDDRLLYRAAIKADKSKNIREVEIEMDSLCHFEKSLLGLKYAIIRSNVLINFREINGVTCVAFARFNIGLKFTTKKFQQTEDFVSEFVTIDAQSGAGEIGKGDAYKRSSLYKHGNKFDTPFWKGLNIPVQTEEEEALIHELERKGKTKEGISGN